MTCLMVRQFCMKNVLILCLLLLSSCISQPSERDVLYSVAREEDNPIIIKYYLAE